MDNSKLTPLFPITQQMIEDKQQLEESIYFMRGENASLNAKNQIMEGRITDLEAVHRASDFSFQLDEANTI